MKILLSSVFIIIAMTAISCQAKQTQNESTTDTTKIVEEKAGTPLYFDSIAYVDSAIVNPTEGTHVNIKSVLPKGSNTIVCDSISAWIVEQFGYSGKAEIKDLGSMVKEAGKKMLKEGDDDVRNLISERDDEDGSMFTVNYEYEVEISKVYEDDEVLTLSCTRYTYMAGAHGTAVVKGATFSKADGHQYGWELVSKYSKKDLRKEIIKGLKTYFSIASLGPDGDHDLYDNLFLSNDENTPFSKMYSDFPLPATAPWLTNEGVVLLYQQYEIAPYAAGMPECIIPRNK